MNLTIVRTQAAARSMSDVEHFALIVLITAAAVVAAVLSNRISERLRVPAPAIFLVAAAVASDLVPALGRVSVITVQRIVTVALIILFDGGMHIGWRRFREPPAPVVWIGVVGTFVTAGGDGRAGAPAVRLRLAAGAAAGHGAGADRPGRGVLGAGPPRGLRAHRHPPGGRVRAPTTRSASR